jgi:iron complex transport system ATP-binding protein
VTELTLRDLSVELGRRRVLALDALTLAGGRLVGIVGANGAGKTTLLRAIAGLVPRRGTIALDGEPLDRLDAVHRARRLSYLPQGQHVHWPLEVGEVVALGRLPHRRYGAGPSAADTAAVARALELADVTHLTGRRVDRLSGGERARVLLARALAVEAPLLLADEPTTSLDPYHQLQLLETLSAYATAERLVLVVLHDLTLAARYCDTVLLVAEGRLLASGPPEAVLDDERLAVAFRIAAARGRHEGEPYLLPWRRRPGR